MRLHCKQEKDGGKLTIPIPIFLANPSHHIKCMFKLIFELVSPTLVKYPERCKGIDETCIKKYTSCIVSKNRNLPIDQFLPKAKVLLEHLFNRHHWCGVEWCWVKDLNNTTHELLTKQMENEVIIRYCSLFQSYNLRCRTYFYRTITIK